MRHKRDLKGLEQRRLRAAKLLAQDKSQAEVARILGVSRQSVSRWAMELAEGGREALKRATLGRPRLLDGNQRHELYKALTQGALAAGFPTELWTLNRVAVLIERLFGVQYSSGHVWRVLQALGFSCQKPVGRATQRDEAAIQSWKRRRWAQGKKTPPPREERSSSSTNRGSRSDPAE